jgi:hypothetical protein
VSGGSRGTFTRDGDKDADHPPSRVVYNKKGTTNPAVVLEKKKFVVTDKAFYEPENLAKLRKFDKEGEHFKDLHEMDRPFLPTYVTAMRFAFSTQHSLRSMPGSYTTASPKQLINALGQPVPTLLQP